MYRLSARGGKIIEVVVESNGSNYYASQLHVEGSGTGVDAIPVFDEHGLNTSVIFDDPKLKNLELDKIGRPAGAGQGFQERPWTWDETANLKYVKTRPGVLTAVFPMTLRWDTPKDPLWSFATLRMMGRFEALHGILVLLYWLIIWATVYYRWR